MYIESNMSWNTQIHGSSNDNVLLDLGNRIDEPILYFLMLVFQVDQLIDIDVSMEIQRIHRRYDLLRKGLKFNITSYKIYKHFIKTK